MKRVWLNAPGLDSYIEAAWRRSALVALATAAAWSGCGLGVDTPYGPRSESLVTLFRQITEGRGWWQKYSTCCDLVGWLLASLGCRDESIVNRDDDDLDGVPDDKEQSGQDVWDGPGEKHWRVSMNIALLDGGSIKAGCAYDPPLALPSMGDLFLIGDNQDPGYGGVEHVGAIISDPELLSSDSSASVYEVTTVEAGQVDGGGQCVKEFTRHLTVKHGANGAKGPEVWIAAPGQRGRRVKRFYDITKYQLTAPAQVPDDVLVGREAT